MNCPHCGTDVDEHEAGRCLDAWVAEAVMGLQRVMIDPEDGEALFKRQPGALSYGFVPQYSISIAAAWEVVGRWPERGLFRLEGPYFDGWEVGRLDDMAEFQFLARAKSAPLAICRAGLKGVGE